MSIFSRGVSWKGGKLCTQVCFKHTMPHGTYEGLGANEGEGVQWCKAHISQDDKTESRVLALICLWGLLRSFLSLGPDQ